jgi:hypothetical protein
MSSSVQASSRTRFVFFVLLICMALPGFAHADETARRTAAQLGEPIPVAFDGQPLDAVLQYLSTSTGVAVAMDYPAFEPYGVTPDTTVHLAVRNIPAETAIRWTVYAALIQTASRPRPMEAYPIELQMSGGRVLVTLPKPVMMIRPASSQPVEGSREMADPDRDVPVHVLPGVLLTEADVRHARASEDPLGNPAIMAVLDDEAGRALHAYTAAHVGEPLAIFLDGKLVSVPVVMSAVSSPVIITGGRDGFTPEQMRQYLAALRGEPENRAGEAGE